MISRPSKSAKTAGDKRPPLNPDTVADDPNTTTGAADANGVKRRNLRNFFASIRYSLDGFFAAMKHEPSFREDFLFVILLVPFAVILPVNAVSAAVMIAALILIMIVELLNSAIEWTIDYLRPEIHPLAKRIKDMGSAAVFLSYLNAIVVWAILLWPSRTVWERMADWFVS
jgi:diacylglycerol kinase (ATP)